MPRDGANIYNLPFPDVVTDTTIASPVYNGFTHDVAQDLNAPRPIVSGGTGATSADGALTALSAEKASQAVTNYDSHVWLPGSFYSATTATGEPVDGHAFSGIVYQADSNNIVVEARDSTDGKLYIRRKVAGVWGAWTQQAGSVADLEGTYVNVAGDTMTGGLIITYPGPYGASLCLRNATGGTQKTIRVGTPDNLEIVNSANNDVIATLADSGALAVRGDITAKSAAGVGTYYFGSSGSKFLQYDGTSFILGGGALSVPSTAGIGSGGTIVGNHLVAQNNVMAGYSTPHGPATFYFGNDATKYLTFDGAGGYNLHGGGLTVDSGNITSNSAGVGGTYFFGSNATKYLTYDGANFNFNGGQLIASTNVLATGYFMAAASVSTGGTYFFGNSGVQALTGSAGVYEFQAAATVRLAGGFAGKQGSGGGAWGSVHNFWWSGSAVQMWVDTTNIGNVAVTSDYRIKKDVLDLPGMWDTVKALRPIKYTHQDFSPPSHKKHVAEEIIKSRKAAEEDPEAKPREINTGHLFVNDDTEQWGFIAHELQETLVPSAATGVKDSPNTIQSPNPFTVIAALTRALQEAMQRIEALEAR